MGVAVKIRSSNIEMFHSIPDGGLRGIFVGLIMCSYEGVDKEGLG